MNIRSKLVILCSTLFLLVSCQEDRFKQGKVLYEFHCASCHMDDGTGLAQLYPPLDNADWLRENKTRLPEIIVHGISDSLVVNGQLYTIPMSPVYGLSQVEVSNITNYVLSAWSNDLGSMGFREVQEHLEDLKIQD